MSKKTNIHWQEFLLKFFSKNSGKEAKGVNGFILYKHWDGNSERWRVDIFTSENFKKMNQGYQKFLYIKNFQQK